jgi:tellurite resistance protein
MRSLRSPSSSDLRNSRKSKPLSDSQRYVRTHVDLARVDDAPLDERLGYLSSALSESGKEQVLTAAATIMAADGSIDERDRDAVRHVGEKLGMSQAHIRGVIDTAASTIPT